MNRWQSAGTIVLLVVVGVWLSTTNSIALVSLITPTIALPGVPADDVTLELTDRIPTTAEPDPNSRWSGIRVSGGALIMYDYSRQQLVSIELTGPTAGTVAPVLGGEFNVPPVDLVFEPSGHLTAVGYSPAAVTRVSESADPLFGDWADFFGIMSMSVDSSGTGYAIALRRGAKHKGEIIAVTPDGHITHRWGRSLLGRLCVLDDGTVYAVNLAHYRPESPRQFLLAFESGGRRRLFRKITAQHQVSTIEPAPDGGTLVFSRAGRYLSHIDPRGRSARMLVSWTDTRPMLITTEGRWVYAVLSDGTIETYRFAGAGDS